MVGATKLTIPSRVSCREDNHHMSAVFGNRLYFDCIIYIGLGIQKKGLVNKHPKQTKEERNFNKLNKKQILEKREGVDLVF